MNKITKTKNYQQVLIWIFSPTLIFSVLNVRSRGRGGVPHFGQCPKFISFLKKVSPLNWCSIGLNQKRFTWRHDSVLSFMKKEMDKGKADNIVIYSDLLGHSIIGGTIPGDILTTLQRPDIVIINRQDKKIALFELTVSFEKNADSANARKTLSYLDLTKDLTKRGWSAKNVPLEIRHQIARF